MRSERLQKLIESQRATRNLSRPFKTPRSSSPATTRTETRGMAVLKREVNSLHREADDAYSLAKRLETTVQQLELRLRVTEACLTRLHRKETEQATTASKHSETSEQQASASRYTTSARSKEHSNGLRQLRKSQTWSGRRAKWREVLGKATSTYKPVWSSASGSVWDRHSPRSTSTGQQSKSRLVATLSDSGTMSGRRTRGWTARGLSGTTAAHREIEEAAEALCNLR